MKVLYFFLSPCTKDKYIYRHFLVIIITSFKVFLVTLICVFYIPYDIYILYIYGLAWHIIALLYIISHLYFSILYICRCLVLYTFVFIIVTIIKVFNKKIIKTSLWTRSYMVEYFISCTSILFIF